MTPEEMSALEWADYEAEAAALEALDEALIDLAHREALASEPLPIADEEIPF